VPPKIRRIASLDSTVHLYLRNQAFTVWPGRAGRLGQLRASFYDCRSRRSASADSLGEMSYQARRHLPAALTGHFE
jgi:hypothetical protein